MQKIKLTKNKVALVDDEDYAWLSTYSWQCNDRNYAVGKLYAPSFPKGLPLRMHRMIMNCPVDLEVNHLDRNTLNNQKANLVVCSHRMNMRGMLTRAPSGYRGVRFKKGNWYAYIWDGTKQIHLGVYSTPEKAAAVYDAKAYSLFGEDFYRYNFYQGGLSM